MPFCFFWRRLTTTATTETIGHIVVVVLVHQPPAIDQHQPLTRPADYQPTTSRLHYLLCF
ncbi:hypothetical protein [Endozoicomonas euniceicola]|uniref:Secreted protein n=1 Tax=Endozoicomonas euniceicola TaxID=1234143 RepID=A0ABY6GZI1_9GAMM|nr:hypothetical protein [Endozoicomonas euniceicola]UYM18218.1 hypothetical protein NX720_10040 [Endozoicomonas euniceicola]